MTNPDFSPEALQRQQELNELQRLQAENARLERLCEYFLNEYASYEKYNCPWCGGSGHVDDCDKADRNVKAKLAKAEADKSVLRDANKRLKEALAEAADYIGDESAGSAAFWDKYRDALARVKEAPCPKN